jgi:methionine-S-sulfoxide reductase
MWGGAPSFSTVSTALLVATGVLLMGHLAPLASGKPTGPLFRRLLEREVAVNADGGMEAAAGGVPVGEGGEGGVGVNAGKHLHLETFTFAAGCFWGVQLAFERIPGVASSRVGYTGGDTDKPDYRAVSQGTTGHAEAVSIEYDPSVVTYDELLDVLWERHDATTLNRQGNDVGTQYRSAVYYHSAEQKATAEASRNRHASAVGKDIVTQIVPAGVFFDAEDYHQHYLFKGGQSREKGDVSSIRCYG